MADTLSLSSPRHAWQAALQSPLEDVRSAAWGAVPVIAAEAALRGKKSPLRQWILEIVVNAISRGSVELLRESLGRGVWTDAGDKRDLFRAAVRHENIEVLRLLDRSGIDWDNHHRIGVPSHASPELIMALFEGNYRSCPFGFDRWVKHLVTVGNFAAAGLVANAIIEDRIQGFTFSAGGAVPWLRGQAASLRTFGQPELAGVLERLAAKAATS